MFMCLPRFDKQASLLREPKGPNEFSVFLIRLLKFASERLRPFIGNRASAVIGERYERGLGHDPPDGLVKRRHNVRRCAPWRDDRAKASECDCEPQLLERGHIGCKRRTALVEYAQEGSSGCAV